MNALDEILKKRVKTRIMRTNLGHYFIEHYKNKKGNYLLYEEVHKVLLDFADELEKRGNEMINDFSNVGGYANLAIADEIREAVGKE